MKGICISLMSVVSLGTSTALAHPGHVEEVAGHSHWLAYGAIAAAVLIGAGLVVSGYRRISRSSR